MKKNLSVLLESPGDLIFCLAQTQYNNLGDLAINRILLEKLNQYGTVVIWDRDVPDWYYEQLGLTTQQRASEYQWKFNYLIFWAALRFRFSSQHRQIYLVETPGHRYGHTSWPALKISLLTLVHKLIFWLLGVRICTFGVSIGPFDKTLAILEWCRSHILYFYSVRDSLSVAYAKQIGIQRVARFPDLAWLLDSCPEKSNPQLNSPVSPGALTKTDYVVFSFRAQTLNLGDYSEYQQKLYRSLDAIAHLVCQVWSKTLVISYQVEMDQPFCQALAERYASQYNVLFVEDRLDLDAMQHLYGDAFMVISNRLHVLMLAMAVGAIPIALIDTANHSKIMGIFQDASLDRLIVDISTGDTCLSTLSEIARDAVTVRQDLAERYAQNREQGNALFQKIFTPVPVEHLTQPGVITHYDSGSAI